MESLATVESELRRRVIATITEPDERDKQTRIGPSGLGNRCEVCLGEALLGNGQYRGFSMYPWLGTAVHLWLEQNETNPNVYKERKVNVGLVDKYGEIKGTSDRFDADLHSVGDYKLVGKKKIAEYKKGYLVHPDGRVEFFNNTLIEYYIQINLYGLGMENQGEKVEWVSLILIPRDSMSIEDMAVITWHYNRQIALDSLQRAGMLYEYVLENGLAGLESDPECWVCRSKGRI